MVLAAVGLAGEALGVLLFAVPVAAAVGLQAVAGVVDHERSRVSAIPAAVSILLIVGAAAMRRPELALGCLLCFGADWVVAAAGSFTRKRSAFSEARESP